MKVTELSEQRIQDIGHAFGYYDYGTERGLIDAFPSRDAAAAFICGYVRMALESGMLYTTGERGEGYLAYKCPGQKVTLRAAMPFGKSAVRRVKAQRAAALRTNHVRRRDRSAKAAGQGKEALPLCGTGLRAGALSGTGIHAKGAGNGIFGGKPSWNPGNSGYGRKIQVRKIHPSGHAAGRNPPLRQLRGAV